MSSRGSTWVLTWMWSSVNLKKMTDTYHVECLGGSQCGRVVHFTHPVKPGHIWRYKEPMNPFACEAYPMPKIAEETYEAVKEWRLAPGMTDKEDPEAYEQRLILRLRRSCEETS